MLALVPATSSPEYSLKWKINIHVSCFVEMMYYLIVTESDDYCFYLFNSIDFLITYMI